MNVSVDVILRLDSPLNAIEEFDTSGPDAGAAEIAKPTGGVCVTKMSVSSGIISHFSRHDLPVKTKSNFFMNKFLCILVKINKNPECQLLDKQVFLYRHFKIFLKYIFVSLIAFLK